MNKLSRRRLIIFTDQIVLNLTSRKWISLILVFILIFTIVRHLFHDEGREDNCNEFAHIHRLFLNLSAKSEFRTSNYSHNKPSSDCHSGQISSDNIILSFHNLTQFFFLYTSNSFFLNIEKTNDYAEPFLEPKKKPPKLSIA